MKLMKNVNFLLLLMMTCFFVSCDKETTQNLNLDEPISTRMTQWCDGPETDPIPGLIWMHEINGEGECCVIMRFLSAYAGLRVRLATQDFFHETHYVTGQINSDGLAKFCFPAGSGVFQIQIFNNDEPPLPITCNVYDAPC